MGKQAADVHMSAANEGQDKKAGGKDGDGSRSMSKLKDPNQAHETLDITKNVP